MKEYSINKDDNILKSEALNSKGRTNEHKHLQSVRTEEAEYNV